MSRVLLLVILSIGSFGDNEFYVVDSKDLVEKLFLNLPVEKGITELVKAANENRNLQFIECSRDAYCYEFKRHPYLKLQNNYNYLVIEEIGLEDDDIKLWIEIGAYKDNRKLFIREYQRLKRDLNRRFEKIGKEKYITFGSRGEIHMYQLEGKEEGSEIHLDWRIGTCKFGESIIIKYSESRSDKQD